MSSKNQLQHKTTATESIKGKQKESSPSTSSPFSVKRLARKATKSIKSLPSSSSGKAKKSKIQDIQRSENVFGADGDDDESSHNLPIKRTFGGDAKTRLVSIPEIMCESSSEREVGSNNNTKLPITTPIEQDGDADTSSLLERHINSVTTTTTTRPCGWLECRPGIPKSSYYRSRIHKTWSQRLLNPTIQLVIIGDVGVGKTCLCKTFVNSNNNGVESLPILDSKPTICFEVHQTMTKYRGLEFNVVIYDFAGTMDGPGALESVKQYVNNADCLILAFDASGTNGETQLTRYKTFQNLGDIINTSGRIGLPIYLVGTKYDLIRGEDDKLVKRDLAARFAESFDIAGARFTSKNDCSSVTKAFGNMFDLALDYQAEKKMCLCESCILIYDEMKTPKGGSQQQQRLLTRWLSVQHSLIAVSTEEREIEAKLAKQEKRMRRRSVIVSQHDMSLLPSDMYYHHEYGQEEEGIDHTGGNEEYEGEEEDEEEEDYDSESSYSMSDIRDCQDFYGYFAEWCRLFCCT